VLGQALLPGSHAQALAVPAVGNLDLGLAALGELAQAQLAGYFHKVGKVR
jgi:hypothetical protein